MQTGNSAGHSITLTDRASAVLTGVTDVACFNEQIVLLTTALGSVSLSGENLNISQLNLDEGRLAVSGDIRCIEYSDRIKASGEGFFRRLFS